MLAKRFSSVDLWMFCSLKHFSCNEGQMGETNKKPPRKWQMHAESNDEEMASQSKRWKGGYYTAVIKSDGSLHSSIDLTSALKCTFLRSVLLSVFNLRFLSWGLAGRGIATIRDDIVHRKQYRLHYNYTLKIKASILLSADQARDHQATSQGLPLVSGPEF